MNVCMEERNECIQTSLEVLSLTTVEREGVLALSTDLERALMSLFLKLFSAFLTLIIARVRALALRADFKVTSSFLFLISYCCVSLARKSL